MLYFLHKFAQLKSTFAADISFLKYSLTFPCGIDIGFHGISIDF